MITAMKSNIMIGIDEWAGRRHTLLCRADLLSSPGARGYQHATPRSTASACGDGILGGPPVSALTPVCRPGA
jgi:hypothetical protein